MIIIGIKEESKLEPNEKPSIELPKRRNDAKRIAGVIQCALSCIAWHSHDQRMPVFRSGVISEYLEQKACKEHWSVCKCASAQTTRNCERILMNQEDGIRLSGMLKNMTHDEFKKAFNDNEGALEELKELLFLCPKKPVLESTTEELQVNIDILERACNLLSVIKLSKRAKLSDIIDNCEENEREEIRKRDRSYRVKLVEPGEVKKVSASKSTVSAEEKLRKSLSGLGMTAEEIENFIIEKKSK